MPEKLSFGDMEGEDLATTVLTCEGDITDPAFPFKLQHLVTKLQLLISDEEKPIQVTKVEPWNSVRVTFNIPLEAAQRLRQLAERGDQVLRELGILSVQIEGDQVITLTLAGQFNEPQEIVLRKTTEDQNEVASVTINLPNSEPVPGPSTAESAHSNISQFLGHIVGGAPTAVTAASAKAEVPNFPVKSEPSVAFRSPNVVAPVNTEPIPFPPVSTPTAVASTSLLRSSVSSSAKAQPPFGPFPFASMTHAMNTKHGISSSQYLHRPSTNARLPYTASSTILTNTSARNSAFSAPNVALPINRPQNASSPTLQKPTRPMSSPVFNNIVSRVASPNSVVPVSRANVALSSPLLVNLLQSETSNLQSHNKLMPPPAIAANQAAKRKRKPRKPKEKNAEDGNTSNFSSTSSPPSSHIGLRSPVGVDAIGSNLGGFNMPVGTISQSPPTSQLSTMHSIAKAQSSNLNMQTQATNIHPQAQGQPPVSLHAVSVQGQPALSSSRLIQGQPPVSAMHRQALVHHPPMPNIHPQAQGQPQVHTGNLPLHTHIPVGAPQLARPPPNSLPSYAMSVARGTVGNTNRMLFANRDNSLIIRSAEKPNKDNNSEKSSNKPSTSTVSNSTPESNPFPSPPSSSDGKTKQLINPFTGQLESASDDEEEDESLGSLPPFPDFEVENSENGQSERSLSDSGKDNNMSSDTDSGISKSHTDMSQSSTEGALSESIKDQKKSEIVTKTETVTSASVPGEKLKLRLKIDPKAIRESEKKSKDFNLTSNQKPDAGSSSVKKNTSMASSSAATEPRVPPLHISLRGPNAAVVVSPRKEDTKTKHSMGKDRSPRTSRTSSDLFGASASRISDSEKRTKGTRDCKKGKDDYWNQNVKNMSGGGIIEVSDKLNIAHTSSYGTYLPVSTVQRKPSITERDSCKSDVITLTSCATGESVSIHTAAHSRSPLPFHLMVTPDSDTVVAVSSQQSQVDNSSVQVISSLPERTSKSILASSRNHIQESSDNFGVRCDRKKETSSSFGARKSSQLMQKSHLPHTPLDSRNFVQKPSRSNNPHLQTSANCVPITCTVPPISSHSVSVASAVQCCTTSMTSVITSTVDSTVSGISDANTPFLDRKLVSKSHIGGISPLVSDKRQVSNQCNINFSNVRLGAPSENSPLTKTIQNEKPLSNSHTDKVLIKEVQINTSVNKDLTANNCNVSTKDMNCSSESKVVSENSNPVNTKPPFVEKETDCKDSVYNNILDRCKSPLASIVSVTKREIIHDAMDTSEKTLRLIEMKKPPIAQIITVDSIPIQSRVIEVPSRSSSLSVTNSIVKSDLAIEVSSIPSLIPSHGNVFMAPRNTLVLQDCRSSSLSCDSSLEFSQPQITGSDSFLNSHVPTSKAETRKPTLSNTNLDLKTSDIKLEEDSNEQGSSTVPSEESSMDSIDEERKRCLQVSDGKTSTPGPPTETKIDTDASLPVKSKEDISQQNRLSQTVVKTIVVSPSSHPIENSSVKSNSLHQADNTGIPLPQITKAESLQLKDNQAFPPPSSSLPCSSAVDSCSKEVNLSNDATHRNSESIKLEASANKSSESILSSNPVPTRVSPIESPFERTTSPPTVNKVDDSEGPTSDVATPETSHSILSNQSLKCNPVCEPISVMCSSNSSVVTSLISQGRFLSPEVSSGGRVRLIFKGGNPHSVLSSCNSPASVVLPINSAKTVPIKLVTLPGGTAGLSVRSTANPNVVQIIGPKPSAVHVSPSSGNLHSPSPVRLVVSKVAPSVSNQSIATNISRNRVVVKSVVVTGSSSPIKLVPQPVTNICSASTCTVTSSIFTTSFTEKDAPISPSSSSCGSIPPPLLSDHKNGEQSEETEGDISSTFYTDDDKGDANKSSLDSGDSPSPFQSTINQSDMALISSSPEVSISSLSSSSLCSAPSLCPEESIQKLEAIDEMSESKEVPSLDHNPPEIVKSSQIKSSNLENLLNNSSLSNKPSHRETVEKPDESEPCDTSNDSLLGANTSVSNSASSKDIDTPKIHSESLSQSSPKSAIALNLNIVPDISSAEYCTNLPMTLDTMEEPCLVAREVTVQSEDVQSMPNEIMQSNKNEQCTNDSFETVPKCNTGNCETLVVDQTFLLSAVQNDLCVSPEVVIKSEDATEEDEVPVKEETFIRPFKEPKIESKESQSVEDTFNSEISNPEKLAATLVYSKPVKRKCSENAAELIKACMGVEDIPKRGLILKPKEEISTDKLLEPIEKPVEGDAGRMSLRVRRDDSTKKCKDCSSDEELPLSDLITKVRTRERPTRARPSSRETPTELVNCRPGRRRSGSNESQKSDEIRLRNRECKRESKKEEITVKKMPDRTKRPVLKAQGVQKNIHIKDNELKQNVICAKEETNVKRKTRSTGNTDTAVEMTPGKRRRYSKDGHR